MSEPVLDASALLAWLNGEPGTDPVAEALAAGAVISSVNLSEVVAKLADVGGVESEIREALTPLGLDVRTFDRDDAFEAGILRPATRKLGLSLGDRACLALGLRLAQPVMTADRSWANLEIGVEVVLIR
jgi:PIN domain nuclease of toxin-antitoxin system